MSSGAVPPMPTGPSGVDPKTKTTFLSAEKLRDIQENEPGSKIYEYEFQKAKRTFTHAEQTTIINNIAAQVRRWREKFPGIKLMKMRRWLCGEDDSPLSRSEAAREIARDNSDFRDDNPTIFKALTDRNPDKQLLPRLREMLHLRAVQEKQKQKIMSDASLSQESKKSIIEDIEGEIDEKARSYLQTTFSRADVTVEEMKKIDADRAEAAKAEHEAALRGEILIFLKKKKKNHLFAILYIIDISTVVIQSKMHAAPIIHKISDGIGGSCHSAGRLQRCDLCLFEPSGVGFHHVGNRCVPDLFKRRGDHFYFFLRQ
jgi:hypothetical protein